MTDEEHKYILKNKCWPTPNADLLAKNLKYLFIGAGFIFTIYQLFFFKSLSECLIGGIFFSLFCGLGYLNLIEYRSQNKFKSIPYYNIELKQIYSVLLELKWDFDVTQSPFIVAHSHGTFFTSSNKITIIILENEILFHSLASRAKQRNSYAQERFFKQFKHELDFQLNNPSS